MLRITARIADNEGEIGGYNMLDLVLVYTRNNLETWTANALSNIP